MARYAPHKSAAVNPHRVLFLLGVPMIVRFADAVNSCNVTTYFVNRIVI